MSSTPDLAARAATLGHQANREATAAERLAAMQAAHAQAVGDNVIRLLGAAKRVELDLDELAIALVFTVAGRATVAELLVELGLGVQEERQVETVLVALELADLASRVSSPDGDVWSIRRRG